MCFFGLRIMKTINTITSGPCNYFQSCHSLIPNEARHANTVYEQYKFLQAICMTIDLLSSTSACRSIYT